MIQDVVVKDAGIKGKGVFVLRDFQKGEFIFRRRHGQAVYDKDISLLSEEDQRHLCEIDWETSVVLLPPGCYLNHSCDPNAMRKGRYVYAWKEIHQGEEITIDYRLNAHSPQERWECSCESANCTSSVIGDFFSMSEGQQKTYLSYAPKYIRDEYRRRHKRTLLPGDSEV